MVEATGGVDDDPLDPRGLELLDDPARVVLRLVLPAVVR